jgi:ATP-binding cassette subfamily B protein
VHAQLRALQCTRIVVAHRLSTVVEADKIVVLQEGQIAGIGTHAALFATCAAYRDLVRAQADAPGARASEGVAAFVSAPPLRAVPASPAQSVPTIRGEASAVRPGGAAALAARLRATRAVAVAPPTQSRRPMRPPVRGEAE